MWFAVSIALAALCAGLLVKIALFPVFLIMCFIKSWVGVLSKIGCLILGLFYLLMLGIIVMYISMKMWDAVFM